MERIQVWYGDRQAFARRGLPQRWVNVLGRVREPGEGTALSYSLNGGELLPLSLGPDGRRMPGIGDFNVEIDHADLEVGENEVVLRLQDGDEVVEERTVMLTYEGNTRCPLPLVVDWQDDEWPAGVQVVDGLWRCGGGKAVPREIAYDRVLALGDMHWRDYRVRFPVTLYGVNACCYERPSNGYAVGIVVRWQGHHDQGPDDYCSGQPRYAWYPAGALGVLAGRCGTPQRVSLNGWDGVRPIAEQLLPDGDTIVFGRPYELSMSVRSRPGRTSRYAFSVRPPGGDEAWRLEADGKPGELEQGAVVLFSHHMACSFGTVTVDPLD